MSSHPDLAAEQAYIDHAYECLEAARVTATKLESMVEVGRGGTEQARFERDVIWDTILNRLRELDLGDASLVFGRIDREPDAEDPIDSDGEVFYIGRLAVADSRQEPVVVDWRAPVAEPFYRATGRSPMGLVRRRHFATRGRTVLGIEDELFGVAASRLGADPAGLLDPGEKVHHRVNGSNLDDRITGHGSLIAALETARTGRLTDIVATIQAEQ
ncbi:MAG: ATP-dependent DNA helicase, partial [Acidimicrobiales bacterium]